MRAGCRRSGTVSRVDCEQSDQGGPGPEPARGVLHHQAIGEGCWCVTLRWMGLLGALVLVSPTEAFGQAKAGALARVQLLNKKAMDEYDNLEFEAAKVRCSRQWPSLVARRSRATRL